MLIIKQKKLLYFGVIILGVFLLGIPTLYAGDVSDTPAWLGSADEAVDSNAAVEAGTEQLGSTSGDLVYTPVTPCKIVDTRSGAGFLSAGETQYYKVYGSLGSQGGSICLSPVGTPSAAHLSVTVVTPDGQGNLKVFPAGASSSAGLQVNFNNIGTNLANAGTVKCNYLASNDIGIHNSYAGSHVTIQVLGYYSMPEATRLNTYHSSAVTTIPAGSTGGITANCNSDYAVTGGGCNFDNITGHGPYLINSFPTTNGWVCQGYNNYTISKNIWAHAVCSRTPGR